jgi:hypothetical protein
MAGLRLHAQMSETCSMRGSPQGTSTKGILAVTHHPTLGPPSGLQVSGRLPPLAQAGLFPPSSPPQAAILGLPSSQSSQNIPKDSLSFSAEKQEAPTGETQPGIRRPNCAPYFPSSHALGRAPGAEPPRTPGSPVRSTPPRTSTTWIQLISSSRL